jgi:influenza virus NS1A-binding protein
MREARGRFDIAVIEGKVYAVGGCNGTTELATAEVYSSDNSKWTALPPLELARSNVGMTAIYILFGHQDHLSQLIPAVFLFL